VERIDELKLGVLIEEYKTLREEVLTAMTLQQAVIRYSVATIGALLVVGFSLFEKTYSQYIFFGLVPLASYFGLTVWMGEVGRMMRAGKAVASLENKINTLFDDGSLMTWESYLRSSEWGISKQMDWNYLAIIALHLGAAVSSVWFGLVNVWDKYSADRLLTIALSQSALFTIVVLVHLFQGLRFKKL
jgi:hypothetical protein